MKATAFPLPDRMKSLPVDQRGFPVPWFVHQDEPLDFRVLRPDALTLAEKKDICWICGSPLGQFKVFVLGPLGVLQRFTSEAACHRECAEYAVQVCPFIANAAMKRSPRDLPGGTATFEADLANPGVYALYIVRGKTATIGVMAGTLILNLAAPCEVAWFKERRRATNAEVGAAVLIAFERLMQRAKTAAHAEAYRDMLRQTLPFVPMEADTDAKA